MFNTIRKMERYQHRVLTGSKEKVFETFGEAFDYCHKFLFEKETDKKLCAWIEDSFGNITLLVNK